MSTAATTEKKLTAKAKQSLAPALGLTKAEMDGRKIMWGPFALTPDDSETLTLVAKAWNGQKGFVAPAQTLAIWLESERKKLEAEVQTLRVADE